MNILEKFEAKQQAKFLENANIPEFGAGDTIRVNVKIREGTRERVQGLKAYVSRVQVKTTPMPVLQFVKSASVKVWNVYSLSFQAVLKVLSLFAVALSVVRSFTTCVIAVVNQPVFPSVQQVTVWKLLT